MTAVLNQHEFSRKTFLKGGGALVVGFSMLGGGLAAAKASKAAGEDPYASNGPYDQGLIDSWIMVHGDNTVTLKAGKIELGQGSSTGLLMIAAEELDVGMNQMRWATHDTNVTADQGGTWGSSAIRSGGQQVRAAAAAAKDALLSLAAAELGVAKASLSVRDGVVAGGGRSITYGHLVGDKLFNARIPGSGAPSSSQLRSAAQRAAGAPGTKPLGQYSVVGKYRGRIDIPDKVTGRYTYVHNIKVPGMLHGRVVRPRGQGAYGDGTAPEILSVDESSIKSIPGARVVRHKNFLGVVAPTEFAAVQAAARLKVKFADPPVLPGVGNMFKQMRELDSAGKVKASISANTGDFDKAYDAAPIKASGEFRVYYQGGMAIGPECCVAQVTPEGARIFSNTQNAYSTRNTIKTALDEVMGSRAPATNRIRVTYYEGGSVYGPTSPYTDATLAASVMSALVGQPVRLQFMRWDTHGWGNYGPLLLADVRGGADANGKLVAMEYTGFGHAGYSTDATMQQITGSATFGSNGALDRNITGPQYDIVNLRRIGKTLPVENSWFKTSALRAPNTPQAGFAFEQIVDELAYKAKVDPVEFRLNNIATTKADPSQRWAFALKQAAKMANWTPRVAASNLSNDVVVKGMGVALGTFANTRVALIASIEVNRKTGKISVKDLYYGGDTGYVVYPDGAMNNEMGAIMQGVSRALYEQVSFDKRGVISTDWVSYPVLRFVDAPRIHAELTSRSDVPNDEGSTVAKSGALSSGSGEPGLTAGPSSIANAFFDATGVRIRTMPMTPARVRGVLEAAGRLA